MNPVIGILTCGMKDKQHFVPDSYVTAIRLSGGLPILIPVFPPNWDVTGILSLCDGFLLPGGGDFTPLLFDENPLPGIGETNLELDVFQIHFTEEILKLRKPLLGICRGMQLINLAAGGTIYQDLSLQPGTPFLHTQTSQNRSDVSHQVFIEKESLLHTITGDSLYTNSFHHQSIHLTGENCLRTYLRRNGRSYRTYWTSLRRRSTVASGSHVLPFFGHEEIIFLLCPEGFTIGT